MMSTAPASSGKPNLNAASIEPMNSLVEQLQRRRARCPAPMMSLIVFVASSTVSNTPSSVRYASGLRVTRTHTFADHAERALAARRSRR